MSTQYDALVATMNMKYSHDQLSYFKALCDGVNRNELTMNQAYKNAKAGFSNADGDTEDPKSSEKTKGGFMGSFNLWVQHAVDQGWIQQGAQIYTGAKSNLEETGSIIKKPEDTKKKNVVGTVIAFTVIAAAIGFTAYVIYKNKKK